MVAAAALALISCRTEEIEPSSEGDLILREYIAVIDGGVSTKVSFGNPVGDEGALTIPASFDDGDRIALVSADMHTVAEGTVAEDGKKLTAYVPEGFVPAAAYYPYDSFDQETGRLTVPARQYPDVNPVLLTGATDDGETFTFTASEEVPSALVRFTLTGNVRLKEIILHINEENASVNDTPAHTMTWSSGHSLSGEPYDVYFAVNARPQAWLSFEFKTDDVEGADSNLFRRNVNCINLKAGSFIDLGPLALGKDDISGGAVLWKFGTDGDGTCGWTVRTSGASIDNDANPHYATVTMTQLSSGAYRGDIANASAFQANCGTYRYLAVMSSMENPYTGGGSISKGPNVTFDTSLLGDYGSNVNYRRFDTKADGVNVLCYDMLSEFSRGTVWTSTLSYQDFAAESFQFKVADLSVNGGTAPTYKVYWIGFFNNMEDIEAMIAETEAELGLYDHPCAYVTEADIDRVKTAVRRADSSDPVYAAWNRLCSNRYAQSSYTASPVEILVRGDATGTGVSKENYMNACRDAAAAFQLGLRYRISGDKQYADAAIGILNEWADVCRLITANDKNMYLVAGFQGYQFANAAELLRDYDGWEASDLADFKEWLLSVWYPNNKWFIDNHGGSENCDLHYWSNWELANLASIMAIGIFTDSPEMISYVDKQFREGEGSGALHNMIPYAPVPDPAGLTSTPIAQCMESGRDQGHATLVSSMCAELCQMAWNIGLDFYGLENDLVLSMFEYTARYNSGDIDSPVEMPFMQYEYCPEGCGCSGNHGATHTEISAEGRGTERPCWDLIYNHYKSQGLSDSQLYYTKQFAEQLRYTDGTLTGDGGAGDSRYGSNSSAFDQIGWGTLLFYQE